MSMRAGRLRHKITIQEVTETADGMGGFTETWSEYTTAFASITPMKGMEALEHRKLGHETVHKVWMRYQSGISTKMRVVWGDRTMDMIDYRIPDERNEMIELTVKETT